MSKISLDDRDIMHTRLPDGSRVFAYYAFDDLSGAMVGIAHDKKKEAPLFINCMRNMFRFLDKKDLGIPMQVEVEHHLVSNFKDGLMKVGNVFPFVRWCNPTNSQEKYAERLIGVKKYGVEKKNNQNVGRHYSRLDANRIVEQKIFDAENNNYKKATASYEQIVANDLQEMEAYNNELHPNQKMFKGMRRIDVFLHYVNPDLPKLDKAQLVKYIGNVTKTSVRRSQYVQVNYEKYQLSSPEVLNRLAPNNYTVEAYYLPSEDQSISEVFIYQNDHFICKCEPVPTFNRANSEWTDKDKQGYHDAMKYISKFDKMVKQDTEASISTVKVIKNKEYYQDVEPKTLPTTPDNSIQNDDFETLLNDYNEENQQKQAVKSL